MKYGIVFGLIAVLAGCGTTVKETLSSSGQDGDPPAIAAAPSEAPPSPATDAGAPTPNPTTEKVERRDAPLRAAAPKAPAPAKERYAGDPNADLIGMWKGEIQMPKAAADDPMAKMAEGMAKMLMGRLKLEIKPGNAFVLNMMFPIEGTLARKGSKLTLKPTKMMGMTPDEAKKAAAEQGAADMDMESMTATVSKDGKTITVANDKPEDGRMVFTRAPAENRIVLATVTAEEKPFVGEWKGEMSGGGPAGATAEEKKQAEAMLKVMNSGLGLTLRADNTFTMNMMMELEGKWKAKGGKVTLELLELAGMGGNQAQNDPVVFQATDGGKTLRATKEGQTITFRKK